MHSGGELKLTALTELSVNEEGKLVANVIDAQSDVKKKRGIRGKMQENKVEAKAEYVEKGLQLLGGYGYLSKGNLIDFFDRAQVVPEDGAITAIGENIYVKGDKLTVIVDELSSSYVKKIFSSYLGEDPVSGVIYYEAFENGLNHVSKMELNLPGQNMKITAQNKDYSIRVR